LEIVAWIACAAVGLAVLLRIARRIFWKAACRAGAAKIHRELTALFRGEHEHVCSSRASFPGVDWSGYDAVRDALTERGFRYVGAYENLTVSRVYPQNRALVEAYAEADGSAIAGTYGMQGSQIVDFGSETTDGRLILTTNATLDKMAPPPDIDRVILAADASIDDLRAAHHGRVAAAIQNEATLRFRRIVDIDDVMDSCRRVMGIVARHRRSLGLLTEAEILAMSTQGQEATAREVWKELRRLVDEERARAA
jgi:hypothetical protein